MPDLVIQPITTPSEVEQCAQLMATSEPWITLRRGFEASLAILKEDSRERYLTYMAGVLAGFLILNMRGAFVGYVQTICVAPECRGGGIGTALLNFAEERIFREFPNVFMCVSSFNVGARRLYERLGYQEVGELVDYIVPGYSEILLRKSRGSLVEFQQRWPSGV